MKKWLCVLLACLLLVGGTAALAMTESEAIACAKEAVWHRLGDDTVPLGDAQAYAVSAVYSEYRDGYRVSFEPKVLDYGLCMVWVDESETRVERADTPGYTGHAV